MSAIFWSDFWTKKQKEKILINRIVPVNDQFIKSTCSKLFEKTKKLLW